MVDRTGRPRFGGKIDYRNRSRSIGLAQPSSNTRVCFWCDEPPTARRPLFVHASMPDGPMHRACAIVKLKLDPAAADAELEEVT